MKCKYDGYIPNNVKILFNIYVFCKLEIAKTYLQKLVTYKSHIITSIYYTNLSAKMF